MTAPDPVQPCPLCHPDQETVLWRRDACRVILAAEADYPGFCRVVWTAHVAEMTDLDPHERETLMAAVFGVEAALRSVLDPDKINLASLGNQVPHLHWHLIPRWRDDPTFPGAVWSAPARPPAARVVDPDALAAAIATELDRVFGS
jgi:diadenosine tetraphosphate (Ap4A) HIT family hydrolase